MKLKLLTFLIILGSFSTASASVILTNWNTCKDGDVSVLEALICMENHGHLSIGGMNASKDKTNKTIKTINFEDSPSGANDWDPDVFATYQKDGIKVITSAGFVFYIDTNWEIRLLNNGSADRTRIDIRSMCTGADISVGGSNTPFTNTPLNNWYDVGEPADLIPAMSTKDPEGNDIDPAGTMTVSQDCTACLNRDSFTGFLTATDYASIPQDWKDNCMVSTDTGELPFSKNFSVKNISANLRISVESCEDNDFGTCACQGSGDLNSSSKYLCYVTNKGPLIAEVAGEARWMSSEGVNFLLALFTEQEIASKSLAEIAADTNTRSTSFNNAVDALTDDGNQLSVGDSNTVLNLMKPNTRLNIPHSKTGGALTIPSRVRYFDISSRRDAQRNITRKKVGGGFKSGYNANTASQRAPRVVVHDNKRTEFNHYSNSKFTAPKSETRIRVKGPGAAAQFNNMELSNLDAGGEEGGGEVGGGEEDPWQASEILHMTPAEDEMANPYDATYGGMDDSASTEVLCKNCQ